MESFIAFGRGPLFRLCFTLMLLGLGRVLFLTISNTIAAYRRNEDKIVPWKDVMLKTLGWLIPVQRLLHRRPIYSVVSVLFHVGLILVPLFYASHVALWRKSVGFGWFMLPEGLSGWLTIICIASGIALFLMRVLYAPARAISRRQDYFWPLLLIVPFITGMLCVDGKLSAGGYQWSMMIHIYSADMIMLLIPFTKIAHCVLAPLSQIVTAVGWKFPAGAGDRVIKSLGYPDKPTWVEQPRID
jgi:nitrate reductase gamma subunit